MPPNDVHAFAARLMEQVWEPFKAEKLHDSITLMLLGIIENRVSATQIWKTG